MEGFNLPTVGRDRGSKGGSRSGSNNSNVIRQHHELASQQNPYINQAQTSVVWCTERVHRSKNPYDLDYEMSDQNC
jgi:hypothetical protein